MFPPPCSVVPATAEELSADVDLWMGRSDETQRMDGEFFRYSSGTALSSGKVDQNNAFIRVQIMISSCPVSGNKQLEIHDSSENLCIHHCQYLI